MTGEKRIRGRILVIGALPEAFMENLKEILPDFETNGIVLEPGDCFLNYLSFFITDLYFPCIILLYRQDRVQNSKFFDDLEQKLPKVCLWTVPKLQMWEEKTKRAKDSLRGMMKSALTDLERKNKE